MSVLPKSFDYRSVNAFICEKIHAAFSGGGFLTHSAA